MNGHEQLQGFAHLRDRCFFRLSGPDRARYLNGQVTQDVARLVAGQTLHTCLTNAKGRMQADGFITVLDDSLLLDAPADVREVLGPRLERYIIADDVEVHDETGDWQLAHMLGMDLQQADLGAGSVVTRSERFGVAGQDVFSRGSWPGAAAKGRELTAGELDDLRIRHGIPVWGRELDAETLPPEAGLEARSISYNKGCYVGQEVISRIRSAGKTNRMLVVLKLAAGLPADLTGSLLWTAESTLERPAGVVTSWTAAEGLAPRMALGFVMRRAAEQGIFALRLGEGTIIQQAAQR
jgi:folate-binding protein YgfZ